MGPFFRICALGALLLAAVAGVQAQSTCSRKFGSGCRTCKSDRCTSVTDINLYTISNNKAVFQAGVEPGPTRKGRNCRPGTFKSRPGNAACSRCPADTYTKRFRATACQVCPVWQTSDGTGTGCKYRECKKKFGVGCRRCDATRCGQLTDAYYYEGLPNGVIVCSGGVEPHNNAVGARSCLPGHAKELAGNFPCRRCTGDTFAPGARQRFCQKCAAVQVANAAHTACEFRECTSKWGPGCVRCTTTECTRVSDESLYTLEDGAAVLLAGVEPGPNRSGRACRPGSFKAETGSAACSPCTGRGYTPFFRSTSCLECPEIGSVSDDHTNCAVP